MSASIPMRSARRLISLAIRSFANSNASNSDSADNAPVDRLQLGAHAQRLIDDPVLALAFSLVERDLAATWLNSAVGEQEQREAAYRLVWALRTARQKLITLAGDAKMLLAEQKRREAEAQHKAEREGLA